MHVVPGVRTAANSQLTAVVMRCHAATLEQVVKGCGADNTLALFALLFTLHCVTDLVARYCRCTSMWISGGLHVGSLLISGEHKMLWQLEVLRDKSLWR